jgi:cyclase
MKDYKRDLFLGAYGYLFEMARRLRRNETEAEKLLWSKLCTIQLGVKFRRQHPLLEYVVDFYCHSHRLVIEVDGSVHNRRCAIFDDSVRSQALKEFNIEIIRFTNNEVFLDIESVLERIRVQLNKSRTCTKYP